MTLENLCELIELQDEMKKQVLLLTQQMDFTPMDEHIVALTNPDRSEDAYTSLKEIVGEELPNVKMLCCYLRAALITYEKYQTLGIDNKIYVETMKCFPRFVGECLERRGIFGFDSAAASWGYRQLNTTLMRIGTLEYEWKIRNNEKVVCIHIPSDADLSLTTLKSSYIAARKLLQEKIPEYANAPIVCVSWLLYKGLEDFLHPDSRILQFQRCFDIKQQNPPSDSNLRFIFQRADCSDYAALPERTSLQRNVKSLLLSGGGIGSGYGVLKEGLDKPI